MGNNQDFGYFGKGTSGYVHYTQTHNAAFPHTSKPTASGGSHFFTLCLPVVLLCLFFAVIGISGSLYAIKYYCIGFIGLGEFFVEFIGWLSLPVLSIGLPIYLFFKQ